MLTRRASFAVVIVIGLVLYYFAPTLRAKHTFDTQMSTGNESPPETIDTPKRRSVFTDPPPTVTDGAASQKRVEEQPPVDKPLKDDVPRNSDAPAQSTSKPLLVIITPSSRPHYLTRSMFSVLRLRECFDVRWVVSHDKKDAGLFHAPLFRDVFEWITEISSYDAKSIVGNHQRNVALAYVYQRWGDAQGHVYFLDDDNNMPDLCDELRRSKEMIQNGHLYFGNQYRCSKLRLGTSTKSFDSQSTVAGQVRNMMDTGSFLSPLNVLNREKIEWDLKDYGADGIFFTTLIERMLAKGEGKLIVRLADVKFLYNDVSTCHGSPWSAAELNQTLSLYRKQLGEMETVRKGLPKNTLMDRSETSFHEYVHVLHNIRTSLGAAPAVYVEIGVWKGATSLFMARHPHPTEVIGIDGFYMQHQRSEADGYVGSMGAASRIRFLSSSSQTALMSLKTMLQGKAIDFLFIDGDHSLAGATSDFNLYSPLVRSGGYIVFDDFMDTRMSGGVREAIMTLIKDGGISTQLYDVFGCIENAAKAGPYFTNDPTFYDWQRVTGNEYILRKR